MALSFGTACHGAGRQLSRSAARKRISGGDLRRQLEQRGIVRSPTRTTSAWCASSSAPGSPPVAQLRPLGVVKG
jgi:RNA-splicing ligase RtcB